MYILIGSTTCSACKAAEKLMEENEIIYIKQNIDTLDPVRKLAWTKFINEELQTSSLPQVLKYIGGLGQLEKDIKLEQIRVRNG